MQDANASADESIILVLLEHSDLNTKMVNSLWPSDVIWHHREKSSLIQTLACYLFGTKEFAFTNYQNLSPGPLGISVKFETKYKYFL